MTEDMVRAITHPVGDWFYVQRVHDGDRGDRWFIERVVLWALRSGDKFVDHVSAIVTNGLPSGDDGDWFYVLGTDECPDGKSWNEVYRSVRPSQMMVREITSLARTWEKAH